MKFSEEVDRRTKELSKEWPLDRKPKEVSMEGPLDMPPRDGHRD